MRNYLRHRAARTDRRCACIRPTGPTDARPRLRADSVYNTVDRRLAEILREPTEAFAIASAPDYGAHEDLQRAYVAQRHVALCAHASATPLRTTCGRCSTQRALRALPVVSVARPSQLRRSSSLKASGLSILLPRIRKGTCASASSDNSAYARAHRHDRRRPDRRH